MRTESNVDNIWGRVLRREERDRTGLVGFYNYTVILTYIGVGSGIIGIGFCVGNRLSAAIVCLLVSGFCDLFDGSIAKTRQRNEQEKKFGIQIDSLADLICFGVLPAAIGFAIGLDRWYEMLVVVFYVIAALIRLAYYNVTEDELQINKRTSRIAYDGLPVTTASLLIPFIYTLRPWLAAYFSYAYWGWLLTLGVAFITKIKVRKLGMKGMIVMACLGAMVLVVLVIGWNRT